MRGSPWKKMRKRMPKWIAMLSLCPLLGCVVAQAPGKGQLLHIHEPTTGGWYWLYLPEDYVRGEGEAKLTGRHWPLVVSFHGMRPFDDANPQAREWQQEADRYGFVVVAPKLNSCDLLAPFPIRSVHPGVERDERLTMAALNDVAKRVDVDPHAVLSTSWSSGGYLAHYMANKHPERFSCVGVRQSNFSASLLDAARVPKYQDHKIGIFYTENDFAICREESQAAARWYNKHGFDVTFAIFQDLGHERRPSVAADFFARTCGATAKTPPLELAQMQVNEISLEAVAKATSRPAVPVAQPAPSPDRRSRAVASTVLAKAQRFERAQYTPAPRSEPPRPFQRPSPTPAPAKTTDTAVLPGNGKAIEAGPVRIRVSSTIGIAPVLVNFSALVPRELRRGAYYLWTDNGIPISNDMNGQKYLVEPGRHDLELLLTTAGGRQYRATRAITVLERIGGREQARSSAGSAAYQN
jgi:predicted esterase